MILLYSSFEFHYFTVQLLLFLPFVCWFICYLLFAYICLLRPFNIHFFQFISVECRFYLLADVDNNKSKKTRLKWHMRCVCILLFVSRMNGSGRSVGILLHIIFKCPRKRTHTLNSNWNSTIFWIGWDGGKDKHFGWRWIKAACTRAKISCTEKIV